MIISQTSALCVQLAPITIIIPVLHALKIAQLASQQMALANYANLHLL